MKNYFLTFIIIILSKTVCLSQTTNANTQPPKQEKTYQLNLPDWAIKKTLEALGKEPAKEVIEIINYIMQVQYTTDHLPADTTKKVIPKKKP